jgi:hypothetical protein
LERERASESERERKREKRERERERETDREGEEPPPGRPAPSAHMLSKVLVDDFIQTSVYGKYSGSMKFTKYLDHISHCKTASGTNWSHRWTYRVFIRTIHRD